MRLPGEMGNAIPEPGVLGRAAIIFLAMVIVLLLVFLDIAVLEAHLAPCRLVGLDVERWRCVCACMCALIQMPHGGE